MVRSINRKTWLLRAGSEAGAGAGAGAAPGSPCQEIQVGKSRQEVQAAQDAHTHTGGRRGGHNATERNIWINAIFYFHILLLLLLPYNGPCIKGCLPLLRFIQVASFSFGEKGTMPRTGKGIAINPQTLIFFVLPTANCCGSCCSNSSVHPLHPDLSLLPPCHIRQNPRCGLSGIIN